MREISGSVLEIVYRNDENNYTVLALAVEDELVTCVGYIPAINPGEFVSVQGDFTTHKLYGEQFVISHISSALPTTQEDMCVFLGSGIIKGVGPVVALRIVSEFGNETFDVIENEPHRLSDVSGISPKKAQKIHEQFSELVDVRDTIVQLEKLGLSLAQSMSAFEAFGKGAPALILENPYKLTEIHGYGFDKADTLARTLGMEKYAKVRNLYGIQHILKLQLEEGHTCFPHDRLVARAIEFLGIDATMATQEVQKLLDMGRLRERTYNGVRAISLNFANESESSSGAKLVVLATAPSRMDANMRVANDIISQSKLSGEQETALKLALENTVCVITGGPGTGKTTILNELISIFEFSGMTTDLAAPTGRAAKRMESTTGRKAQTIHRLLEFGMGEGGFEGGRFGRNEDHPLECDVLIVDETSMVDVFLFSALMDAIRPGTRVIITGDSDQLPSVGAGNVLGDIIISGHIPIARLTQIFRQTGSIAVAAHCVNQGEPPYIAGEFELHAAKNTQPALNIPTRLYTSATGEVQVMCPVKRGLIGVNNLNEQLRDLVNPPSNSIPQIEVGERIFRLGDRVMQTANDYQKEWRDSDLTEGVGVFNGDMGIIHSVNTAAREIEILFDGERLCTYSVKELSKVEHSYAITVHKSQGSEFDCIIIPLYYHPNNFLTRNLLYTAMTRAKFKLHIVGLWSTLEAMTLNNRISRRFTGLNYEIIYEAQRTTTACEQSTDFKDLIKRIADV